MRRPAWQRLLVVLAGPMANMALALVLCVILALGWGVTSVVPSVGDVVKGTPAERAGLQKGDLILSVDGVPVETWQEMSDAIGGGGGGTLRLEIARTADGAESVFEVSVQPERSERKTIFGETETAWLIGIKSSGAHVTKRLGFLESVAAGVGQCGSMLSLTWQGFVKLAQRVIPADQVGGPIMIAQIIGESSSQGLAGLLGLAALISVNLGILNLLPVPVLDGGTIVFCVWEIVFRRPMNRKVLDYSTRVGVALLAALMLFATFNDVMRIISD